MSQTLALTRLQRVFLIDQPLIVLALRAIFHTRFKDMAMICGAAPNFNSSYDAIGKMQPAVDLVISDINHGSGPNLEKMRQLISFYPKIRILVMTQEKEEIYGLRAMRAGAIGFISKMQTPEQMAEHIRKALEGKSVLSDELSSIIIGNFSGGRGLQVKATITEVLSNRELEVFTLLGDGKGTRKIAELLNLSIKTIESHRAHIKEKLCLKDAYELINLAFAFRRGEV